VCAKRRRGRYGENLGAPTAENSTCAYPHRIRAVLCDSRRTSPIHSKRRPGGAGGSRCYPHPRSGSNPARRNWLAYHERAEIFALPPISPFRKYATRPGLRILTPGSLSLNSLNSSNYAMPIFSLNKASLMATARSLRTCAQS
jgi:hypothetical protein